MEQKGTGVAEMYMFICFQCTRNASCVVQVDFRVLFDSLNLAFFIHLWFLFSFSFFAATFCLGLMALISGVAFY